MLYRNFKIKARPINIKSSMTFLKNHSGEIMLHSLFICGLIMGTAVVCSSEYCSYIVNMFFYEINDNQLLINGILAVTVVMISNFVMGLCLVGTPFICFMSIFEGSFIGGIYSYQIIVSEYEGFGLFLVTELLFYIILYMLFVLSQHSAIKMSSELKLYFCRNRGEVNVRSYLLKFAVYTATGIFVVLLKTVTNRIL